MKNGFLQSQAELDEARAWLVAHGYPTHHDPRKDWDLRHVIEYLGEADILDMGCFGSMVLPTAKLLPGLNCRKAGIDLQPCPPVDGIEYHVADLTALPFPPASFDTITCLSVLEHNVNFIQFVKSVYRTLRQGGKLFITFDYWPTPIDTSAYPNWKILHESNVASLLDLLDIANLERPHVFDWTVGEPCIEHLGLRYTFGMISAVKS